MIGVKRSGGYRSRRYIFRDYPARAEMEALARAADWQLVRDWPGNPETEEPPIVTWELLPGLRVSYSEDTGVNRALALATSFVGESALQSPTTFLAAHPNTYSLEELLTEFDSAPEDSDEQSAAVARLGLGAPLEEDERFVERIDRMLHSPDDFVREGAVWAALHSEWSVFRGALERISMSDGDPFLRELAADGIGQLDRIAAEEA